MIDLSILLRKCNKSLERLGDLLVDLYKTNLSCSSQLNCFLAFSLLNSCNSRIESNNINSVVALDIVISRELLVTVLLDVTVGWTISS